MALARRKSRFWALLSFFGLKLIAQEPGTVLWTNAWVQGVESSPALGADGTIYIGTSGYLCAISSSGQLQWRFEVGGDVRSSPVVADDGTIYFGCNDQKVYALNPDGTERWRFATTGAVPHTAALGADGTIYICSSADKLYALNPDGTERWELAAGFGFDSSVVVRADGTILLGNADGAVYAVNPDGTKRWTFATSFFGAPHPSVGAEDSVYLGGFDGRVYSLTSGGTRIWDYDTGGNILSAPAVGADGTVYCGSWSKKFYALTSTGTLKWEFAPGGIVDSTPALAEDGTVYIGSENGTFFALNSDGTKRWEISTGSAIRSSPLIAPDGTVYFASQYGGLYAVKGTAPLADAPWPMFQRDIRHSGRQRHPEHPKFTKQPESRTAVEGDSVTLAAGVKGAEPMFFQWLFNGQPLPGATNMALDLTPVTLAQTGWYQLRASNTYGSELSQAARLTVNPLPPRIVTQPQGQSVPVGAPATFVVEVLGAPPFAYQWMKDGVALPGATNASLTIPAVTSRDAGDYTVKISNSGGTVTSAVAHLTVLIELPVITEQPHSQAVVAGGSASFSVTATGSPPLRFQWQFEGANIAGATNATLVLQNVSASQVGLYTVVVSNEAGSVTSAAASLTLLQAPRIVTQPKAENVVMGDTVHLRVVAEGSEPLSYQWYKDYTPLAGANQASLLLTNVQTAQSGSYQVEVSNAAGSCFSYSVKFLVIDFNVSPGTKLWDLKTGISWASGTFWVKSSPAIGADGTVYVGSLDGKLYAVTPLGNLKWVFETGDEINASPAIGPNGDVYIGSDDGKLYAVDSSGARQWEFRTGGRVESSPAIGTDGTIYVGSTDNRLYALNPNGLKKWEYATSDDIVSSPAIGEDGTIYFGTAGGLIVALNPDGTRKWQYNSGSSAVKSSPALGVDGTIFVGSDASRLYALNPDGTRKWYYSASGVVASSPAVALDRTIYFGANRVYALDEAGKKKWDFTPGSRCESSPVLGADGTVYIGSDDKKVYAISANGTKLWEYLTGGAVKSSPVLSPDGVLYVGSNDERLYAIKAATGPMQSAWPMFRHDPLRTGNAALALLTPPRLSAPCWRDGAFEALLTDASPRPCRIEVSSDLQTWTLLTNMVSAGTSVRLRDTSAGQSPLRFYRAVRQP